MNITGTGRLCRIVFYCNCKKVTEAMSREEQDLMDVNGDSLAVEGMRDDAGGNYNPVQNRIR